MKKRKLLLTAVALSLVLALGIGGTWAYFTTYATAKGQLAVQLGYETDITEHVEGLEKTITIEAQKNSEPVYVRVMAYTGSQYDLSIGGEGWSKGAGGYYYYNVPINGKGTDDQRVTKPLKVTLSGIPEFAEDKETANIVIMYESTPVFYVEEGGQMVAKADWNMILDSGNGTVGGGE